MSWRDAVLTGVTRASELHAELGIRTALADGAGAVDVYSAAQALGLFLMFRPLNGLLGAYVPTRDLCGVLVTTKRDLHVQRFTAAHELGHHILSHRTLSLDKVVGFVGRGEANSHDLQEVEADAFAAEFLLPKWLIVAHLNRQGWGTRDLSQQDIVYQLSLRLGASYSATCWALLSHNLLPRAAVERLQGEEPKAAKQRALPGVPETDWRRDVWVLSEKDKGARLIGAPQDIIVLSLDENLSAGYAWDVQGVANAGMNLKRDERLTGDSLRIGGTVQRRFIIQGEGEGHLHLEERRAWDISQSRRASFEIDFNLAGRAQAGRPKTYRSLAA